MRQGKPAVSKQELDNLSCGPKETHTASRRCRLRKSITGLIYGETGAARAWRSHGPATYLSSHFVCPASVLLFVVFFSFLFFFPSLSFSLSFCCLMLKRREISWKMCICGPCICVTRIFPYIDKLIVYAFRSMPRFSIDQYFIRHKNICTTKIYWRYKWMINDRNVNATLRDKRHNKLKVKWGILLFQSCFIYKGILVIHFVSWLWQ